MLGLAVGFVIWQQEDFIAREWTLSAPPRGLHRAAWVSQFDLQGDANHSLRFNLSGEWRKWMDVGTQSEMADQKWKLIWSRDGSLIALQQAPGMLGDPLIKKPIYTDAFDFRQQKTCESSDSWRERPRSPFSGRIEAMMKARGGAVAGRETTKKLGVWRWQDRDLKDAL